MSGAGRWAIVLILLFLVLAVAIFAIVLVTLGVTPSSIDPGRVLVLRLDGAIEESKATDPFTEVFSKGRLDLRDIVLGLEEAAEDDSIIGLFVEIRSPGMGFAQLEEVHQAILDFRKSGKKTFAFLETAGEFSAGVGHYVLASACESIYLAPPGDVALINLRAETPFYRGLFDKLEIKPEFGQRKEYKNAVNTYTHSDYTDAHRRATSMLLDTLTTSLVDAIVAGRELTEERVREVIDNGPYVASRALEIGLVDALFYRDEVEAKIEEWAGEKDPFLSLASYVEERRPYSRGGRRIALIYAVGGVQRGSSKRASMFSGDVLGSDTVSRALRRAREDDAISAVVLRVDSPGGSYVASDIIRREVELTKEIKPVVVSMGNYAASGGYFISMQATHIVAGSGTLTGSIGVFAGKLVTRDFWRNKIGINYQGLGPGKNGDFYSSQEPYSEFARARLEEMLDRIYMDFVGKAAEGRGKTYDEFEPLAHGRVWVGSDAFERELVDELGGLKTALHRAARLAGLEEDERFRVKVLPEVPGFWAQFFESSEVSIDLPKEIEHALQTLHTTTRPINETVLLDPSLPVFY